MAAKWKGRRERNERVRRWCEEANGLDARAETLLLAIPEAVVVLAAWEARPGARSSKTRGPRQTVLREISESLTRKHPEPHRLHREADALYWQMLLLWEDSHKIEADRIAGYWGLDVDDVYQTILIGWYQAAIRFQPERGLSLFTPASYHVRVAVQRSGLLDRCGIYVPANVACGGREPTHVISLDVPFGARWKTGVRDDMTYADLVTTDGQMSSKHHHPAGSQVPGEIGVSQASDRARLCGMLDHLPESDARVLRLRYLDLDGVSEEDLSTGLRSLNSVGEAIGGRSRERVRQIELRAIQRLRDVFNPPTRLAKVPTGRRASMAP